MIRSVEARTRELARDIRKGVVVLSDEVKLNDKATMADRKALLYLRPFDCQEFNNFIISHIAEIRGQERFRMNDTYTLNCLMLGGMMGFALQLTEHRQLAAWLRMLHNAEDELQFVGKLAFQYVSQGQSRILTPTLAAVDRRTLPLKESWDNLIRIMIPVLGENLVNFEYK